jgi:hypothetical protein
MAARGALVSVAGFARPNPVEEVVQLRAGRGGRHLQGKKDEQDSDGLSES